MIGDLAPFGEPMYQSSCISMSTLTVLIRISTNVQFQPVDGSDKGEQDVLNGR